MGPAATAEAEEPSFPTPDDSKAPATPPPAPGDRGDAAPADSSRAESTWFDPPAAVRRVAGSPQWEERRGWQPPPASHGLLFAGVSFLLIGAAIGGTIFFLTPPEPPTPHRTVDPALLPVPLSLPTPDPGASTTAGVVNLGSTPPAKTSPQVAPSRPPPAPIPLQPRRLAPPTKPAEGAPPHTPTLPDLDPAARAAGMAPQREDMFSTPSGLDTPPTTAPPRQH
jgi:hypothetical protein